MVIKGHYYWCNAFLSTNSTISISLAALSSPIQPKNFGKGDL